MSTISQFYLIYTRSSAKGKYTLRRSIFIKTYTYLAFYLALLSASLFVVGITTDKLYAENITMDTTSPVVHLSLEDAVYHAFTHTGRAGMAEERVRVQEAIAGQSRALRMPQLNTSLLFSYIDQMRSPLPSGSLIGRVFPVGDFLPNRETLTAQVNLDQVLYAGGGIQAAIRTTEAMSSAERHRQEYALATLEQEVKDAYVQLQYFGALVDVAQQSVETFQKHLEDTQQLQDAGMVTSFEVLRAETELGARMTDLTSARTATEIAHIHLCRLLGLPQDSKVFLTDNLDWSPIDISMEDYITTALHHRPELNALEAVELAAEAELNRVRADYLPRASARVQYQKIEGAGQMTPDGWSFQIGGEWSIYAGGRRKQATLEAQARKRETEYELHDALGLVEMDVRQAYLRIEESIEKIHQENRRVLLAEEGLRLAHIRYEEGVSVQTEILDAALAHRQAQTGYIAALREHAEARNALIRATAKDTLARHWLGKEELSAKGYQNPNHK